MAGHLIGTEEEIVLTLIFKLVELNSGDGLEMACHLVVTMEGNTV